ncbi:hypothetical protein ABB04_17260, partial [Bacillus tropicus]|nr:hypothetical protein [Bacillus tropicus]
LFKEKTPSI